MATSGSTTLSSRRDEIIARALRLVGGLGQGETPSANQTSEAVIALNMFIKWLGTKGILLWKREEISVTPVAGTQTYTLQASNTSKPLKIYDVSYVNTTSNVSIDIRPLSRADWDVINTGAISGTPNQCWFEPRRADSRLHLFPIPDSTFASNNTISVYVQAQMESMTADANEPDIPSEYFDLLVYGLAKRLSTEYGVDAKTRAYISEDLREIIESLSFNAEDESIFFQPDRGM
jgi:hypothetical protein